MAAESRTGRSTKLEILERILLLEHERGFDNRAVMGGLDRFLSSWQQELKGNADFTTLEWLERCLAKVYSQVQHLPTKSIPNYAELTQADRENWSDNVLQFIVGQQLARSRYSTLQKTADVPGKTPAKSARPHKAEFSLSSPIQAMNGIGPGISEKFETLGIVSIRDLLYHFPRRHVALKMIRDLTPGQESTIAGIIWDARVVRLGAGGRAATEAVVGDETGNIRVLWFNQPFLSRSLQVNQRVLISGQLRSFRNHLTLEATDHQILTDSEIFPPQNSLIPFYPATEGLTQRTIRRTIRQALDSWLPQLNDHMPASIQTRHKLLTLTDAIKNYHYPANEIALKEAHHRLAFDELLLLQLLVLSRKHSWQHSGSGIQLVPDRDLLSAFLGSLPFSLTKAQELALEEILGGIASPQPMARLLQGEVGSGKTVVVLAAMLMAAAQGYQAAIMAPTEVLAEQHFLTFTRLLRGLSRPVDEPYMLSASIDPFPKPIGIGLLLGSLKAKEKEAVRQQIQSHALDIVVGTHALIQDEVGFPRLAFAVVDEEHRFGVMQRRLLGEKGERLHMLSMTATPIPRSLALTLYGDLDISTIAELPAGRRRVRTRWARPDQRIAVYNFIREQVKMGRQIFVVCPLIHESERLQTRAALEEHRHLSEQVFSDLRVGLLHGRMTLTEKLKAMESFRSFEMDILVSTPVIEVGVDIPNASVILIDGADRFGLSELHQFRGRVGRGEHPSYCILMADDPSRDAQERLTIMESEEDGFRVAEEDLRIRGPGQLMGTRQSGLPDLKLASLSDLELLRLAREEANIVLGVDQELVLKENAGLAAMLDSITKHSDSAEKPSPKLQ